MAEMNYNKASLATELCINVAHLAQAWPPTQLHLQARSQITNATTTIEIRMPQGQGSKWPHFGAFSLVCKQALRPQAAGWGFFKYSARAHPNLACMHPLSHKTQLGVGVRLPMSNVVIVVTNSVS